MSIFAFKNGVSVLDEDTMNSLLTLQDFQLIYEGVLRDSKSGAGVTENHLNEANLCARFTLTGSTELGRIVLNLDKDGDGQDLTVEIRKSMDPAAGDDGTLLKSVTFPKEFIETTASEISIPIGLTGLTAGNNYWIVLKQVGDATDRIDWIGEASADGSYPTYYRNGASGNWTSGNALHFKVYSGVDGVPFHETYSGNVIISTKYDSGQPQTLSYYIPDVEEGDGIRSVLTLNYDAGKITGGDIS